nr:DUF1778 domain-containing protein [Herbaspirillum sp. B39]
MFLKCQPNQHLVERHSRKLACEATLIVLYNSLSMIENVKHSAIILGQMTNEKTIAVNFRVRPEVRELLQAAAKLEHRSMTNMVEVLVLEYCRNHGIEIANFERSSGSKD